MAHEVETMMYAKELPWHGLGTYVGENPIPYREAIRLSGLDWTVTLEEAGARTKGVEGPFPIEPAFHPSPDYRAVVRDSDFSVLAMVGTKYRPVQNNEAFEFLDAVLDTGNVRYHTAGSLRGGKKVWLLAELPEEYQIEPTPGDVTKPYLLLSNSHDGSSHLRCMLTSTRVVCMNTLRIALSSSDEGISIRHTGDVKAKIEEAQRVLGFAAKETQGYREVAAQLLRHQMNMKKFREFINELVPLPADAEEAKKATRVINQHDAMAGLFDNGPGVKLPGVYGTRWAALNAVTAFTTHLRSTRVSGVRKVAAGDTVKAALAEREARLEAGWFGSGDAVNQKALKILLTA